MDCKLLKNINLDIAQLGSGRSVVDGSVRIIWWHHKVSQYLYSAFLTEGCLVESDGPENLRALRPGTPAPTFANITFWKSQMVFAIAINTWLTNWGRFNHADKILEAWNIAFGAHCAVGDLIQDFLRQPGEAEGLI